jgi:hypothetical protein
VLYDEISKESQIRGIRTFIGETTHIASPSTPILKKRDKRIDICATSPAPGDDGI